MFRTLLLAAILGVSAVNAAFVPTPAGLEARQTLPASSCPSNTRKCASSRASVTAYCSSYMYISISDVTITTTRIIRSTSTSTNTRTIITIAAIITSPPEIITSTITNCVAPAVTPLPVDDTPWDPLTEGEPWPERRAVDNPSVEQRQATPTVRKPTCLNNLSARSTLSAACRCFSIRPKTLTRTATSTVRATLAVTVTSTVWITRTVAGSPSTTFVFPQPTFLIANNRGGFAEAECNGADEQVGQARISFDDTPASAILFDWNSDRSLSALEGKQGTVFEVVPLPGEDPDVSVLSGRPGTDSVRPLVCGIVQSGDGTCPLTCRVNGTTDVSQGSCFNDWYLGPPGHVTEYTYSIFAVTRSDAEQRGTCSDARARFMSTVD